MVTFTDRAAKIEPPVIRRLRELLEAEVGAGESDDRHSDKAPAAAPREVVSDA